MPRLGYKPTIHECALLLLDVLRRDNDNFYNQPISLLPGDFLRELWNRSNLKGGLTGTVAEYLLEWNWLFAETPSGFIVTHMRHVNELPQVPTAKAKRAYKEVKQAAFPFERIEAELEEFYAENWQ
jgi:hypothetical protein